MTKKVKNRCSDNVILVFSWAKAKQDAVDTHVRRAMTMAKSGANADFNIMHPDWVRDAHKQNADYTDLKIKVKQATVKKQEQALKRRDKFVGK